MTAYELADKLSTKVFTGDYGEHTDWTVDDAVNMLRQQADRLGVLEANHEIQKEINQKALEYISELEKGLRSSLDLNKAQAGRQAKQLDMAEFLPIWKDYIRDVKDVMNVQLVAHHFYNLGAQGIK